MKTYGACINLNSGEIEVYGCKTKQRAIARVVSSAISAGWKPRKWWQFWHPPVSKEIKQEYKRQTRK